MSKRQLAFSIKSIMSNFNDLSIDFPSNMTCFFKNYPVVDEVPSNIYNRPPVFVTCESDGQQNRTIPMHDRVGYEDFNKQESFSQPVFPQYYQYENPLPPDVNTTVANTEYVRTIRICRKRFTQDQLEILEDAFKADKYVSFARRVDLANLLNSSESRIAGWFKKRRSKQKRLDSQTVVRLKPAMGLPYLNPGYSQFGIH